jgi:hypothetical protein
MSQLVKTKPQANFKGFKRFGAFKGLVEQKNLFNSSNKLLLFPPSAFKFRFLIVIYVYKNFVMEGCGAILPTSSWCRDKQQKYCQKFCEICCKKKEWL